MYEADKPQQMTLRRAHPVDAEQCWPPMIGISTIIHAAGRRVFRREKRDADYPTRLGYRRITRVAREQPITWMQGAAAAARCSSDGTQTFSQRRCAMRQR